MSYRFIQGFGMQCASSIHCKVASCPGIAYGALPGFRVTRLGEALGSYMKISEVVHILGSLHCHC
jgi:hypothetical protein